jgi:hypothetical protein
MIIISRTSLIVLALFSSLLFCVSCSNNDVADPVDCTTSTLAVSSTSINPSSCSVNDGTITATATGGDGPYQFALDAQSFGSNSSFIGLGGGIYQLKVKDKNDCERSTNVILTPIGSTLASTVTSTANSGCKASNGAIEINASGGTGPYAYKLNEGAASSANTFSSLTAGSYTVKVIDNAGCSVTQTINVLSGIRLSVEIKNIIDASCAVSGCHVAGGSAPVSFTSLTNIVSSANAIKNRTEDGTMPKGGAKLSQDKLNAIACWVEDGAPNN